MSPAGQQERSARIVLSCVSEPADPVLGQLLACHPAAEIVAAIQARAGDPPRVGERTGEGYPDRGRGPSREGGGTCERLPDRNGALVLAGCLARDTDFPGQGERVASRVSRALDRWAARLGSAPGPAQLASWEQAGIRVICPGDAEWPSQLDALSAQRPVLLWAQGQASLRHACLSSVSVVGSRAATAYGSHVCTELAAGLAERGFTVVSGGAYGIDAAAHRAALAAGGATVAVLAGGLTYGYPRGHQQLFAAITGPGVLISESPPDRPPNRPGFLIRNRLIAALSRGTVVVEAALRSGALSTAARARELCRPLMAVPGPVTSAMSAGCHELIRDEGATLVTRTSEVIELVSPAGTGLAAARHGPVVARDALDPDCAAVLEALPARGGSGPAQVAVTAGLTLDTALHCLGLLAAAGFAERAPAGWRIRRPARPGS